MAAVASLAVCGSAGAQTIVGQLPATTPEFGCGVAPLEVAPRAITGGNSYLVPHDGVLTSWSTYATTGDGQKLTFKVLRPVADVAYTVVAHDGPRPLLPAQVNTFRVAIPVKQGDLLALNTTNSVQAENACVFEAAGEGDLVDISERGVDAADGQSWAIFGFDGPLRLNAQATVLGAPTLGAIAKATGPVSGGTRVVIPGTNLAEVSAVTIGGKPATFSVESEAQISAIAPKSTKLGAAAIEVTTIAGKALAPTPFGYVGCKVPQLRAKTLSAAKKKLRAAGCKLGKVKRLRGASVRTGKVSRQAPAAGKILAPGARVTVTLKG